MELPELTIIFDPEIKQFDLKSLKTNQIPKKCDKLIENFIEDLNHINEIKYYNRHRYLYILTIFIFILTIFTSFHKLPIVFLFIFLFIFFSIFFWIVFKYKLMSMKIKKTIKEYSKLLKRYYKIKSFFSLGTFLEKFFKNNFKINKNKIILQNLKKCEFIVFNNSNISNIKNEHEMTISDESIIEEENVKTKELAKKELKKIFFGKNKKKKFNLKENKKQENEPFKEIQDFERKDSEGNVEYYIKETKSDQNYCKENENFEDRVFKDINFNRFN